MSRPEVGIPVTDDSDVVHRETTSRFLVLRLDVEVRTDGLHVRLLPLEQAFRHVAIDEIIEARVASYTASRYAGWHWGRRATPGGRTVYRLRGDRGVQVSLTEGREFFIGSQDPERLRAAIARII